LNRARAKAAAGFGADFGCLCCLSPPAHNNVSVSLVTATRPPVRIALAVDPAAAAPRGVCVPSGVCVPRGVCVPSACVPGACVPGACVPALHSDAVSPVTNHQRHRWCPPNMLRTAMLCPPQIARPKWCVPGACPQWCVPGGVPQWCVPGGVPRWRVPGGVSPVVCP
jgi:hypothetical protein